MRYSLPLAFVVLATTAGPSFAAEELKVSPAGPPIEAMAAEAPIPSRLGLEAGDRSAVLVALGSGLRTKLGFKVYEGVLYLEDGVKLPPDPYPALIQGDYAKRVEMRFLRDVDSGKIVDAWEDGIERAFKEMRVTAEMEADRERFLDYFRGRDLAENEVVSLTWIPGVGLVTEIGAERHPAIDSRDLASALMAIWLGDKPISRSLKEDMVRLWREEE